MGAAVRAERTRKAQSRASRLAQHRGQMKTAAFIPAPTIPLVPQTVCRENRDGALRPSRFLEAPKPAAASTPAAPVTKWEKREITSEGGDQSQALTPTSRTNENSSSIYHSSSTNDVGGSESDILSPTSRTNDENQVYSRTNDTSSATENSLSPTSDRASDSSSSQSTRNYGASGNGNSASQSSQYSTGQNGAMNIQVQGESSSDQSLGQQIRQQLSGNSSLTSLTSPIQIRVNNGVVTVQGSVRTQQQKQQIETAVQGITGVSRVDNQLTVSSDQTNR